MTYFIIGMIILVGGGFVYGHYCEKVFGPDDRKTPAVAIADGVDYVAMPKWKNMLIELLNIAGTGPVLGPIQGILFGPVAFLTIPIGCVIAGSMHDYFSGMISMRNDGAQIPKLVKKYLGNALHNIYLVVIFVLMLLVVSVFVYTPGDLLAHDILGFDPKSSAIWVIYGCIFIYYICSTIFPIDVIIGRIYPIFGAILLITAVGIFGGILLDGGANLHNLTEAKGLFDIHPKGQVYLPAFFITVACGILSGFHSTQASLISRTVKSEKEGRQTFYNMMLVEGFIAMSWAGGAMIIMNRGLGDPNATLMVGITAKTFMGNFGGLLAILGVVVLPITSGDTAMRSLRLMIGERFNIDQKSAKNRVLLTMCLFIPALIVLIIAKTNAEGFGILWRYFGWTNQFVSLFMLATITVYLRLHGKNYLVGLIPGMFYTFVVSSYILNAKIGFNLDALLGFKGYQVSYIVAAVLTVLFAACAIKSADKKAKNPEMLK